jgi:propanediol utilization protein
MVEALFGKGHQLTFNNAMSQPGPFFATEETVSLVGLKGKIDWVKTLGPV